MENSRILFISYYSHQAEYFEILKSALENEYQVYHLKATQSFLKGFIKSFDKYSVSQDELEEMIDYSYQQFKISRGQKGDKGLNRLYNIILKKSARVLYNYYFNFIKEKQIDLIIIWNGYRIQVTPALKVADQLGIKKLYLENGFFPETLVMDEQGVNAANSLKNKDKSFYQKVEVDRKKLKKLKRSQLEQRELKEEGLNKLRKKLIVEKNIELPDKFIFLPFQVLTDSQIIINSPLIDDMYQLVDVVYDAIEKFNQQNNQDYWLVAKEHPSDFGKRDYQDLKEKYAEKKVMFLTKMPVEDLINLSEAIVTINSTVGIEGLLKGKPVVTLGNAFYNIEDVVYHVDDLSKLEQIITKAVFSDLNNQLIDKFLYYLRYEYLVEADKKNASQENVGQAIDRIKEILN